MFLYEVAATKAHTLYESKIKAFKAVADALNGNSDSLTKVDAKSVRKRYDRLQKPFLIDEDCDALRSGVGRDFTEHEELLSEMREAREEKKRKSNDKRNYSQPRAEKNL